MHFFPFLVIELSFLPLHHASYYEIFHLIHFSRNSTLHFYRVSTHPITKKVHFLPFPVIEFHRLQHQRASYSEKSTFSTFFRNRKRRAHVQRHALRKAHRLKKFFKIVRPCGVIIDSGWNCTPYTGSVLCCSAIISFFAVFAVTSRHSGRLSGSTISE